MAKAKRRKRNRKPAPGLITVEVDLLVRVLEVIDWSLRDHYEAPRRGPRGNIIWGGSEWPNFLEAEMDLEAKITGILRKRQFEIDLEKALAKRLRELGVKPPAQLLPVSNPAVRR